MRSRVDKLGSFLLVVAGVWFWAAVLGLFLEKQFPFLHSFALLTFGIYFGTFAVLILGLTVVGPGIYVAKEIYEMVYDTRSSTLEKRLTIFWCAGAGLLFSLLLGTAFALMALGVLADVKLWFIGVCWLLLFLPWCAIGFLGRKIVRRLFILPNQKKPFVE